MLNNGEREWINRYHKKVYNNLKGLMIKNEILDLKDACSII